MGFLKFSGILQVIVEEYPNIDVINFLQEELKLPDYKAEELAARIEKAYCQKTTNDIEQKSVRILSEKQIKPDLTTKSGAYSVESLSEKEFEHFIVWLLEELGYSIQPEKYPAPLGVDLIATNDGERIAIQARKYPKTYSILNPILWMSDQAKRTFGCQSSIIISTSYFTQQTLEEAQKLGVEIWDADTLTTKINEVREKDDLEPPSRFPRFVGSLLQSLLRLEETEHFIVEPKAGGKFDLHLPGVKYPLLTFQAQNDNISRCVYRIKNNQPVGENEGISVISVDRNNIRHGPDDLQAYALVMQYLEEFLE